MPSTVLHALLPTGCAATSPFCPPRPSRGDWIRFLIACAVLANLCDLDLVVATLWASHFNQIHRNWGHNIFALAVWVGVGYAMLRAWGAPWLSRARTWALAVPLVLSHVVFDAMTVPQPSVMGRPPLPSGVPLLWPILTEHWSLPWVIFRGVPAQGIYANPLWDRICSRELWEVSIVSEVEYGAIFFAVWLALGFAVRGAVALRRRAARKPSAPVVGTGN
jgi:membrane-bound metal-dependent hydrolase YbcI (DUF457 family)